MVISQDEIKKIEDVIARAEEKTSGEIVPMIVGSSSVSGHVEPMIAAVLAVLVLAANWAFSEHIVFPWWTTIAEFVAILAIAFCVGRTAWALRVMTLNSDLYKQVYTRALNEFMQAGLEKTDGSTGVLLFVSEAERWAVVLADKSISSKLPPETWNEVVALLIGGLKSGNVAKGFTDAIAKTGDVLAQHFPIRPQDKNELPNKFIIKD